MRRAILAAAVAAVLVAFVFVRVQPAGTARVVRRGSSLAVAKERVAFVLPGGQSCFAPRRGDQLLFRRTLRGGDFDLNVNFAYDPPQTLPRDWPAGDWCTSVAAFVDQHVHTIASEDPRAAESQISAELQQALATANLNTSSVSARLDLPRGWERTRPVAEVAKLAGNAPPLIFIGLDGADWELLDDYAARGVMPNLARLVRDGTSGVLETEHPPLSPLLWTTMMTGVSPLEHQILDFTHFNASTGEKEPITSDERAVPAIWNMATMGGKRVAVFGLWATYPAEPVNGLLVSDRLFTFLYAESTPPPGVVFPPSREPWARASVSAADGAIDFATMKHFLPWLTESEAADLAREPNPYSKPGSALRRILVETEIYRRLATGISPLPDLTIMYIQGTDTIGHVFAPFAAPKQPEVTEDDYDKYHEVPELYFHHIDEILGEFIRTAERNHGRIMLASDHGFRWKEGRPIKLSSVATATAAKWHRNEGIFLLWGAGIPPTGGHRTHGGIRQICATLLQTCALPGASGIEKALVLGPHSSDVRSIDYRHFFTPFVASTPTAASAASANEALAKLKALGYIGSSESTAPRPAGLASTKTAGAYNNAGLILKHDGRIADAIASFDQALKIDPSLASAAWNLSDLFFSRNERLDDADDLLLRALQNGLPEAPSYVIERAIRYQRSGHAGRSLRLLEGAVARKSDDPELRMFRGRYRVEQKNCAGALEDFQAVERARPTDAVAWASAGLAQVCLGDRAGAEASFQRSLEINPNQPVLRRYLSQ